MSHSFSTPGAISGSHQIEFEGRISNRAVYTTIGLALTSFWVTVALIVF
ncbi:hypothetical protein [Sphingomonas sp.]|nr:hypothetical protein [Sphingomonas sp.]HTG37440.1 hypothetical protein [Sphingomonas sp.]